MKPIKFGLVGAGGFGREVMPFVKESVARSLSIVSGEIDIFFIETWEPKNLVVNGYPVLSLNEFVQLPGEKFYNIAIADGKARETIASAVGERAQPLSLHSDRAIILDCNEISTGAVFCPNTMVTSNARIGKFFQCNIYAYVAHDCVIGDYVTFAPGVRCNGRVHIEDYAYIGTNVVIREGAEDKPIRIGRGAVLGMGAVITKDVPAGQTVVGNPARPLEKR